MAGEADEVRRILWRAAEEAVRRVGEDLLGEAQRLAPVEEGTLRGSGELEVENTAALSPRAGSEIVATVSFNTVYAARQHEETEWNHPKGGQAKYLEAPLHDRAGRYEHIIGLAMKAAL